MRFTHTKPKFDSEQKVTLHRPFLRAGRGVRSQHGTLAGTSSAKFCIMGTGTPTPPQAQASRRDALSRRGTPSAGFLPKMC